MCRRQAGLRYGRPVPSDVDAMVARWRSWIEEPIRHDVIGMHFRRMVWREVNDILGANPDVADLPSAFWDFYHENYAAAQAISIRRQADRDKRTCSLAVLIEGMRDNAERFTRGYYVGLLDEHQAHDELMMQRAHSDFDRLAGPGDHLDPDVPARDLAALRNDAKRVSVYVNEHLAHDMGEPTVADPPTFADLHAAIDSVGEIFRKYAVARAGAWWATFEPAIQYDWRAIFRVPWLAS